MLFDVFFRLAAQTYKKWKNEKTMAAALAIGGPGPGWGWAGAAPGRWLPELVPKAEKDGKVDVIGRSPGHRRSGPGLGLLVAIGNRQPGDWARLGDFQAWLGQI